MSSSDLVPVAGSAEFIASHLCGKLLKLGYKVVGLDSLNTYYDVSLKKARLAILSKEKNFSFFQVDISDQEEVSSLFKGRDVNIAFVNELALIFERIGIDTLEVPEAAGTKWNSLPVRPGLVGGYCIGIEPDYLTCKAESLGYHSEVILRRLRINDNMGIHIAEVVIKFMARRELSLNKANVLVLGITFKENCPDIRNSRVIDVVTELKTFGTNVDAYDRQADPIEVMNEYNLQMIDQPNKKI